MEYHPYLRQEALLELARRHDLLLTAYCSLARGLRLIDPPWAPDWNAPGDC